MQPTEMSTGQKKQLPDKEPLKDFCEGSVKITEMA